MTARRIRVALGEEPADTAIVGADVFNVFTGDFVQSDVLVADGYVAAVLPHGTSFRAAERVEAVGGYLVPGFVDAHAHIESSMVCPEEFAAAAVACGVTTVIADPHEIANIFGADGIRYMLEATENAAARIFFMLPSCVPASSLEEAATVLSAADLACFLGSPRVLGLGEMMNYPGVLNRDQGVMEKISMIRQYSEAAFGPLRGLALDGHAPHVSGRALQAYVGAGIGSDHEASTPDEARERLALGMGLMMREGSAAKNLLDLVPAVTRDSAHLCMLCSDDRQPVDIVNEGCVNAMVAKLVADGRLPLATILRMASWNTARHFSLRDTGAVAPGFRADFALYPDLVSWKPGQVWLGGRLAARQGACVLSVKKASAEKLRNSVVLPENMAAAALRVADKGMPVKVIEIIPRQIVTKKSVMRLPAKDGALVADPACDVAKLAVFERHRGTGRVGLGFVKGMGIKSGAVASTIAHDSHNLVALGMDDASMIAAVNALRAAGGGLAVTAEGMAPHVLPLPLGGLFSDKPLSEVAAALEDIAATVRRLGLAEGNDPFMTLAFLSLAVIPHLKLTDGGLVDVDAFALTPLYADEETA